MRGIKVRRTLPACLTLCTEGVCVGATSSRCARGMPLGVAALACLDASLRPGNGSDTSSDFPLYSFTRWRRFKGVGRAITDESEGEGGGNLSRRLFPSASLTLQCETEQGGSHGRAPINIFYTFASNLSKRASLLRPFCLPFVPFGSVQAPTHKPAHTRS